MTAHNERIDRKVRRLKRTLAEWQKRAWSEQNRSMAEIGEKAIRNQLRALSRERQSA